MTQNLSLNPTSIEQEYPRIWSLTLTEPASANPEMVKAGFWIRSIAHLIDQVVLSILGLLFFLVSVLTFNSSPPLTMETASWENIVPAFLLASLATLLIGSLYFSFFHGYTGQTIGKMLCGLKVVNYHGRTISYSRAFFRCMCYLFSYLCFFFGFLWIAVDRERQGWHDKLAQTYVIKV